MSSKNAWVGCRGRTTDDSSVSSVELSRKSMLAILRNHGLSLLENM